MRQSKLAVLVSTALLISGCLGGYPVEGPATIYDSNRPYALPFEKGYAADLYQGYFGTLSHEGEYSLDFLMPIGTRVLAARAGIIEKVVESNTSTCPITKNCEANYIYLRHSDGTQARYIHIDTNGACVQVGELVDQGDVIALSGHIGISSLPHLHFQVVSANPNQLSSEDKPAFRDVNNQGTGFPVPKQSYTSSNSIRIDHCNQDETNP